MKARVAVALGVLAAFLSGAQLLWAASPIKLNGALVAGGTVANNGLQFSPDSSRVVYLADQTTDGVLELFSVPSAGGVATKLNGAMVNGGDVSNMQFSYDSSRLLYLADQTMDEAFEVFSVPSAGVATKLKGALVSGGDVGIWTTSANWKNRFAPDEVMHTVIDRSATITLSGTERQAFSLAVGGGSGASILELQPGAELNVVNDLTMFNGGVLRGDGHIAAGSNSIASGEELRAAAQERLLFSGNVNNAGRIEAIGTSPSPAEIDRIILQKERSS